MSPIVVGEGAGSGQDPGIGTTEEIAHWDLYLAESSDLTVLGPLQDASGINLDLVLNRPGRLQFSYPLDGPLAKEISPINRCVLLAYNGEIFWSGFIMSFQRGMPEEQINVVVTGWQEVLYHRAIRAEVTYINQTRGFIIHELLAIANEQKRTWMEQGTNTDDAPPISKTFEGETTVGQGIEEMTSIEAGPDITVHPQERTLNIQAWDEFVDHTNIIWAYGWGPHNLESFSQSVDGAALINRITVKGKNNAVGGYLTEDILSQTTYQLFENSVTLSNVGDPDILAAYGEAELFYKKNPRVNYQFQPAAGNENPIVFRDFNLGDKCYLKAIYNNVFEVNQAIRVFSCSLSIDDNNVPKMSNMVTVAT